MYEKFTDRARKVMQLANQEAQRFNHEHIGTEHVLLGLCKEGTGIATQALRTYGIDLSKVRLEVEKLVKRGPSMVPMTRLPRTSASNKLLQAANDESCALNHNYIDTEHLLLAFTSPDPVIRKSVGAAVLTKLGAPPHLLRAAVMNILNNDKPSEKRSNELSESTLETLYKNPRSSR